MLWLHACRRPILAVELVGAKAVWLPGNTFMPLIGQAFGVVFDAQVGFQHVSLIINQLVTMFIAHYACTTLDFSVILHWVPLPTNH